MSPNSSPNHLVRGRELEQLSGVQGLAVLGCGWDEGGMRVGGGWGEGGMRVG